MDDETQKAMDAWLEAGNEIKTERSGQIHQRATRNGVGAQCRSHEHAWDILPTAQYKKKYRCIICGAYGYQRIYMNAPFIVEYQCEHRENSTRCLGWSVGVAKCPDHVNDEDFERYVDQFGTDFLGEQRREQRDRRDADSGKPHPDPVEG